MLKYPAPKRAVVEGSNGWTTRPWFADELAEYCRRNDAGVSPLVEIQRGNYYQRLTLRPVGGRTHES